MTKRRSHRGPLGWLVEVCFIALLVVIAVAAAVELVKAIWPVFVLVAGCVIVGWGLVLLVRQRRWRR